MKINLLNPKHNAFAAQIIALYAWNGDFDDLYEAIGTKEPAAKYLKNLFGVTTTEQLDSFIEENKDILYNQSLLRVELPYVRRNKLTRTLEGFLQTVRLLKTHPHFRVLQDLRDGYDAGGDNTDLFCDFVHIPSKDTYWIMVDIANMEHAYLVNRKTTDTVLHFNSLTEFQKHFNL
jgi:hypothetical protein